MTETVKTNSFELTAAQVSEIVTHAKASAPNECCGLFAGQANKIQKVYALRNSEQSPTNYTIDSRDQLRAFRDAEELGLEIISCFHSHVKSAAYPSPTDVRLAFDPEWVYAIVSLQSSEPDLRAFHIVGEQISEVDIVVTPD